MVNSEIAASHDVAEKFVMTPFVLFQFGMRRRHARDFKNAEVFCLVRHDAAWEFHFDAESIHDESAIGLWHDQLHLRIRAQNRHERFLIEMVRVGMARSHHVDEVESLRCDNLFRHAEVRFVRRSVFVRE